MTSMHCKWGMILGMIIRIRVRIELLVIMLISDGNKSALQLTKYFPRDHWRELYEQLLRLEDYSRLSNKILYAITTYDFGDSCKESRILFELNH